MDHNINEASSSVPKGSGIINQQQSSKGMKNPVNQALKTVQKPAGFDYTRAVQGSPSKAVSGVENMSKNAPVPAVKPVMSTYNRFSVLDVQESVKKGTLVEDNSDLYPPENVCTEKCTINKQNEIDPGRILPSWCQFSPSESMNRIIEKDYDITDAQKKRILDALTGEAKAVKAEDQEEWVDGEWDFFYDKCMELDLDPDFCVEDVFEDDSGSAQFISQLAKTGKYFDPVVAKPPKNK